MIIITSKLASWGIDVSIFFNRTEYKHQDITAANIQISPIVKLRVYRLFKFPFKIIAKAPNKDKIIPISWSLEILVRNISQEKPIIITGAVDAIIVEFKTKVVCREIYVKELNIVTLKILNVVISKKFSL